MRVRQGMRAMLRLGSAWHDVAAQVKAVTERGLDPRNFVLCTDDSHSGTLVHEGHMDRVVRHAIDCGCDPLVAIRLATLNTARHFGMARELGSLTPGRRADVILTSDQRRLPVDVVIALRERVQTLKEMAEKAVVWYQPLAEYDEAAVAKHLKPAAAAPLAKARELLAALDEWQVDAVSAALHEAAAALDLGMGKVAQPLRVAITGTQVSPDISQTVYLAGREGALKRIDAALIKIGAA